MPDEFLTTAQHDDRLQATVLRLVLDEHPSTFTRNEIHAQLAPGDDSFGAHDATDRALRDLRSAGLLRCDGDRHHATQPAVRLAALAERA